MRKLDTKEFIRRAKEIHGNKYDYSHANYKGTHICLKIKCKIHGFFDQKPSSHLLGKGCLKCGFKSGAKLQRRTTQQFIKDARKVREHFLDNLPAFKNLKARVGRAAKRGYLKGLDGRKIFIRNDYAALNSLLQGGGAILMKRALAMLNALIKLQTLDARFVANIHDEWQIEVREDLADFVGQLAVDCIQTAGNYYELRCPMDGEYKIGGNWSETH